MPVAITLCDRTADLVQAWKRYFPDESGVKVANQNILTLPVDALAIPANSFGFTDSGVDMAISQEIFDWRLQDTLRLQIDRDHDGELLVGQALVLPTKSTRLRYVVVAPTMRLPTDVSGSVNAYLAMRAILRAVEAHNRANKPTPAEQIRSLAVPGLCTGTGKMPAERAAYQMWTAYRSVIMGDLEWTKSLEKQLEHDRKMRQR
ncbi:MAG: macro domain-containing protein [Chloroflexi bacterium SZAS-1]|jgi:O-acetyl-ADP-ribose deacetylase (regulator of RNase III)|nr:macro domain-containing protein [Chloroflexi bacterium SZAS-1]